MGIFDKFKKTGAEEESAPTPEEEPVVAEEPDTETSEPDAATAEQQQAAETPEVSPPPEGNYRTVQIERGSRGWGGPLTVRPEPGKDLVYSVTGGGIHPLAQHIADMTGGRAFDGFSSSAPFSEIALAIIDCGGTARIGVYPMKGVLTVDVHGVSPSGPLARFITEENFVSGVKPENVSPVDE